MKGRLFKYFKDTSCVFLLVTSYSFNFALSQDDDPLILPLDILQKTSHLVNAPNGLDELLKDPMIEPILRIETENETERSQLESGIVKGLNEVTLEEKILNQRIQNELTQYGYDFFTSLPTTFSPVTNLPVPTDYLIGPGDSIIVQLYGKKNVEYKLVVQRDGRILIPEFGPLEVTGMTFDELEDMLEIRFENGIIGTKIVVTIAEIRTIQVILSGEVAKPGRYMVSGLATLLNALLNSGGVKRTGSLRKIQLKRSGRTQATFDLYDVLLRGDASNDVQLKHNDIIFVPSIGPTVGIGGEIQRPAIYEVNHEQTVGEIIEIAGGVLATASIKNSHIERIVKDRYRTLVELRGQEVHEVKSIKTPIQNGDLIRILPVTNSMKNVVLLSGHVKRPGGYQYKSGYKISNLISGSEDILPNADLNFALLRRELPKTKDIEVLFVDLGKIIQDANSGENFELVSRDELIIFERSHPREQLVANLVDQLERQVKESELPMVVELFGQMKHNGKFPLQRLARLSHVFGAAGGLLPGADRDYILIARTNPKTKRLSMFSVRLDIEQTSNLESYNPIVFPSDRIYVFGKDSNRSKLISNDLNQIVKEAKYGDLSPVVFINGPVHQPGRYPLEIDMQISDLLRAAGGLKEIAYGHRAELTRFSISNEQYQVFHRETMNLSEVLVQPTLLRLAAYDHLKILPKPNWTQKMHVEVSGEIKFPGKYVVHKGDTLCSLINRFGGLRLGAYPFGAVFTRESVRIRQQASIDRLKSQLDELLVQLHLSPSVLNDEKMPSREGNHEVISVIKQLKDKKASGRMVINLQGAHDCGSPEDIALENNDKLHVPVNSGEINVSGQVYFPTSHKKLKGKRSRDYIDFSGGSTVLGKLKHSYVVQANGTVESMRPAGFLRRPKNIEVSSGATIYVPINVDRINGLEKSESWAKTLFQLAFTAAVVF